MSMMKHIRFRDRRAIRIRKNAGKRAGIHKLLYAACLVLMLGLLSGCGDSSRTNLIVTTESVIPEQTTEQVMADEKTETADTTTEDNDENETAISTETGSQTETGVDYD